VGEMTADRFRRYTPRGAGAACGSLPKGYVLVSRWIGAAEVKLWWENGGTHVPPAVGRTSGRVSVFRFGGSMPAGVASDQNIRLDFAFPESHLVRGGSGFLIMQPAANIPIYNVSIQLPSELEIEAVLRNRGV